MSLVWIKHRLAMFVLALLLFTSVFCLITSTSVYGHGEVHTPVVRVEVETPNDTPPTSWEKTILTLRFNSYGQDSDFDISDCDCAVTISKADGTEQQKLSLEPTGKLSATTEVTFKSSGAHILGIMGGPKNGADFSEFGTTNSIDVQNGSTPIENKPSGTVTTVIKITFLVLLIYAMYRFGRRLLQRKVKPKVKSVRKPSDSWYSSTGYRSRLIGFMIGFGLIGSLILIVTQAATPSVSVEPENGIKSAGITSENSSLASNGQLIRFGDSQPNVPTPTMTATVNNATKYQTIQALGVSINAAQWNNGESKVAIDMLTAAGVKQWRVILDEARWEAANDNSDPNVFNDAYYTSVLSTPKLEELWSTIAYLNSKGFGGSDITLSFMGRGPAWMTNDSGRTVDSASEENEWVEMIAATVNYARNTRGLNFKRLQPNNEPDWGGVIEGILMNASWTASSHGKLSQRLDSLGLQDIRISGPDTANIGSGVSSYIPAMKSNSALNSKMDVFGLHDYSGSTGGASNSVGSGKTFWMSEFSAFDDIWPILDQGASGLLMWDGYDSVYEHAVANGLGSTAPNDSFSQWLPLLRYDSNSRTYSTRKAYHLFKQLFLYIPHGSQRIATTSSQNSVMMRSFSESSTGNITVVGHNKSTTQQVIEVTIQNSTLPNSLSYYETRYTEHNNTSDTHNFKQGANLAKVNNKYYVTVPAGMVFTLTSMQ